MILPADISHKEQIATLWNKAFGDKKKDIYTYLETILKYFFVYEDDGIVKGMLSVLPVSFCGKCGGYVYAVTTHEEWRGQGICNKLMDFVKENEKYEFLVLKPQNDGLFKFYENMGFIKVLQLTEKELCVNEQKKYQLLKLSSAEYEMKRNAYFGEDSIIKWDERMLLFAKSMYHGEFYEVKKSKDTIGIAFLYQANNTLVIKELLSKEPEDVAGFLAYELGYKCVRYLIENENGDIGFMIYPKVLNRGYFNIYLD